MLVPLNLTYMIHRNVEWVMLMLGEAIFCLLYEPIHKELICGKNEGLSVGVGGDGPFAFTPVACGEGLREKGFKESGRIFGIFFCGAVIVHNMYVYLIYHNCR